MHRYNSSTLMSPEHLKRQNVRHGSACNAIKKTANQRPLLDYDNYANNANEVLQKP